MDSKATSGIGFLTVAQSDSLGRIGGLLVLNERGRPTEFHCTSPVKPNRAQEILYGPTLDEYLNGEQIARTLIEKLTRPPWLLCTDHASVLAVHACTQVPVILVHTGPSAEGPCENDSAANDRTAIQLGDHWVSLPPDASQGRDMLLNMWQQWGASFDLMEPFQRIHEALREAQRSMAA